MSRTVEFSIASAVAAGSFVCIKLSEAYGGLNSKGVFLEKLGRNEDIPFNCTNNSDNDNTSEEECKAKLKIYFIDHHSESKETLDYNEMEPQINLSAEIKYVFCYKTFQGNDHSKSTTFYHPFLILMTNNDEIYSLEKNRDGISLQKWKNFVDRINKDEKMTVMETESALQNYTMGDVMEYIEYNELDEHYDDEKHEICQQFAKRLCNFISIKKKCKK